MKKLNIREYIGLAKSQLVSDSTELLYLEEVECEYITNPHEKVF